MRAEGSGYCFDRRVGGGRVASKTVASALEKRPRTALDRERTCFDRRAPTSIWTTRRAKDKTLREAAHRETASPADLMPTARSCGQNQNRQARSMDEYEASPAIAEDC